MKGILGWWHRRRELEAMKALIRTRAIERLLDAERRLDGIEAEIASLHRGGGRKSA